ncbi:MAG: ATP-binding cassette domain-containing protein [Planctomycetes bacterium]|nr:ATP-binding cassette domain-containing protein [Planctomycetota bacterium]
MAHGFPGGFSLKVSLRVEDGVCVLLGRSGSGKTTLLRCIAGLETPTQGRIALGDSVWFDSREKINVPTRERGVGMVFQEYALFPHLTAAQNIAFGLRRWGAKQRADRVEELLIAFGLGHARARRPRRLSGGEQQRVALARALAPRPGLLLLDEPLAALDAPLRASVRGFIASAVRDAGVPAVMVTHDPEDAAALGGRRVTLE